MVFIDIYSEKDGFVVIIRKDKLTPLVAFETDGTSFVVHKYVWGPGRKKIEFTPNALGGIKLNSSQAIRVEIDDENVVYIGPTMDELIEALTGVKIRPKESQNGADSETCKDRRADS